MSKRTTLYFREYKIIDADDRTSAVYDDPKDKIKEDLERRCIVLGDGKFLYQTEGVIAHIQLIGSAEEGRKNLEGMHKRVYQKTAAVQIIPGNQQTPSEIEKLFSQHKFEKGLNAEHTN